MTRRPISPWKIVSGLVVVLVVAMLVTGCLEDEEASQQPTSYTVEAGGSLSVAYPEKAVLESSSVLQDSNGTALYLLSPGIEGGQPSAERIDGSEHRPRGLALIAEDGAEVDYVMPADVETGNYDLCNSKDDCVVINVR